jgi:hypothetical protein
MFGGPIRKGEWVQFFLVHLGQVLVGDPQQPFLVAELQVWQP